MSKCGFRFFVEATETLFLVQWFLLKFTHLGNFGYTENQVSVHSWDKNLKPLFSRNMPQNLASPYPLKLYHPNDPPSPCFIMLIKMIILRTRTRIKMIILMMMLMRTTTMTRMMQNLAAGSQTWLLHHHTCLRLTCWLFLS